MAAEAPFTAHIKVVPSRGRSLGTTGQVVRRGGKFDYVRDLEKLAYLVYQELTVDLGTDGCGIMLAKPGGGQHWSSGQFQSTDWGMAITPQYGNQPSLLMIEGFYCVLSNPSAQPHPAMPVFHGNDAMEAPGGPWPWMGTSGNPTTVVENEVCALKILIEDAISDVSDDSGANLGIFRLLYKGITWGDRGHHFPRCAGLVPGDAGGDPR